MKARLLSLTLLATLVAPAIGAERLDHIVAVAEREVVLASELEREVESVRSQFLQRGQRLPPEGALRRHVLDRLVMQRLQLAHAERAGIRVDDATLDAAVQRIATQNGMTLIELRDALAREGVGFTAFRSDLREEIAINRLHQAVTQQQVDINPREIDDALEVAAAHDNVEYRVAHIRVGTPEGASSDDLRRAETRAAELAEEVEDQQADFAALAETFSDATTAENGGELGWRLPGQLPPALAAAVQALDPGEISPVVQAADGFHIVKLLEERREDAQIVVETRARHILLRTGNGVTDNDAQQRLERFRERIAAGESFAALAREYSQDSGSASDGGDLGWTAAGELVPAFQAQLDRLEPGEISAPFRTEYGWHIVRVEQRRERDVTDEQRRERIAQQIFERKRQESLEQWLRRLREEAYVDYRLEGVE